MLTLERPITRKLTLPKTGRQAVIIAGGKGIRLRPYTTLVPKPLVPIGEDHSILEIVMRQLAEQGFERVILAIGHLGNLIRAYVGDGSQWGIEVQYFQETSALGTIGPALMFLNDCPDNFLVMNGDIITNIDYADLLHTHINARSPFTVATYERETKIDFGVLDVRGDRITSFTEKPTMTYAVSMGVYAVARRTLRRYKPGTPLGVDTLIKDMLRRQQHPASYPFNGYWLDIGRPEDYDKANVEFETIKSSLLRDL
ncbi:MAG: sugar phosphate nucleotidyltransferase [Ilumatobacteraceae bacterium]